MKMRTLEDQGSSPEEDIARVRFQRKQGPTQERSTTVPMTPASNSITEGMEEVKKTLRGIQEAINRPIATQAKKIEKKLQMLEKNLEEIRKTIKPRELPRAVGGNRETTNKNEGATDPVADARGHSVSGARAGVTWHGSVQIPGPGHQWGQDPHPHYKEWRLI